MNIPKLDERNNNYQKLPNFEDLQHKREEGLVQLRKKKRQELNQKKRAAIRFEIIEGHSNLPINTV